MTTSKAFALASALALLSVALPAVAETGVETTTSVEAEVKTTNTTDRPTPKPVLRPGVKAEVKAEMRASTTAAKEVRKEERKDEKTEKAMTSQKARADAEISARIKSLTALGARVNGMKKLSADQKASIGAIIQSQISALVALQTAIAAETDATKLKTLLESITKGYRIYALIEPQIAIFAAADRATSLADMLDATAAKLSARLAGLTTEVATSKAFLADLALKTSDARVQASAAVTLVASLMPDNGDKTIAEANRTALKDAKAKIVLAQKALATAREDLNKALRALKEASVEVRANIKTGTDVSR